MRVRFKTISAGPKGALFPGDTLDVSETEAKMLVDGGYADYVELPRHESSDMETMEKPEEMKAMPRRPKRRTADGI